MDDAAPRAGVVVMDSAARSIAVGELADFVELSADPISVDVNTSTNQVGVLDSWLNGKKIDAATFVTQVEALDPTPHPQLSLAAKASQCC